MTRDPALPSHGQVFRMAWPIVISNSSVPLLGLADTAVIGNVGLTAELGAIALGALIFNFIFWGFGFLRMGTTGFTAQASGAGDEAEVRATLGRALLLAGVLGVALLVLQRPAGWAALTLFDASTEVESITERYFFIRIWGAPATLATYAIMGTFIGLGRTRRVLAVQLFLNGLNIALDVLFAGVLGWGAEGIALGTALAEWSAFALALTLVRRELISRHSDAEPFWPAGRVADRGKFLHMLSANADLMIRTLLMLFAFAWFANQGARFGDVTLAANHILLQFISFSAFFLDGFAFAAEALVGRAIGMKRRDAFDVAVRRSTHLAGATAMLLAAGLLLAGDPLIATLTDLPGVRGVSGQFLPYAVVYVAVSFVAFQLDGVFIGATRTREMRDASALSVAVFLAAWWLLGGSETNAALWVAFVAYVVVRGLTLAVRLPAIRPPEHRS